MRHLDFDGRFTACSIEGGVVAFRELCRNYAPEVADPEGCEGQCGLVSNSFLRLLDGLSVPAVNVQLWRDDVPHVVTVADGWAIDWTARQFDPKAEFPVIRPLADFMADGWLLIGHLTPDQIKGASGDVGGGG